MKKEDNPHAAWLDNIKTKAQEIQKGLDETFAFLPTAMELGKKPLFEASLAALIANCQATHMLFGTNLVPKPLRQLTSFLNDWKTNPQNAQLTIQIAQLYIPIGKLSGADTQEGISFTELFERHLQDETLQNYLDELLAALTQLLEAGDDTLTSQAVTDLQRILSGLSTQRQRSFLDVSVWIEFAITSVAACIDSWLGTPLEPIATAAITAAKNSQTCAKDLANKVVQEYANSVNLKSHNKLKAEYRRWLIETRIEDAAAALADPIKLKLLSESGPNALMSSKADQAV